MSHLLLFNSLNYLSVKPKIYYAIVVLIALVVAAVTFYFLVKLYVHK